MNITINDDLTARVVSADGKRGFGLVHNPETLQPFNSEEEIRNFISTRVTDAFFVPLEYPEAPEGDLQAQVVQATQERLDKFAQSKNYDSILSATTYASSKIEKFAKEGQRAIDLRDETWAKLYEILDDVKSDKRPIPSGFADIEGELPELNWGD